MMRLVVYLFACALLTQIFKALGYYLNRKLITYLQYLGSSRLQNQSPRQNPLCSLLGCPFSPIQSFLQDLFVFDF